MYTKKKRKNKIDSQDVISEMTDIGYDEALRLFIQKGRIKRLSDETISYYQLTIKKFIEIMKESNVPIQSLSVRNIENYFIAYYLNKGNKESSINSKLRGVRAFLNFLYNEGYIKNQINLELINEKKEVIKTFTLEQIKKLFKAPDLETFTGFRDFTIMLLMLETGVRVRELIDIRLNDVKLNDGYVVVNGKNGEQRQLPIQNKVNAQITKYLEVRGEVNTDYLFVNIYDQPLSKRQVQDRIKEYGKKAGIKDVRVSPHTFRHTFAKLAIKNGADVFTLQKILGHSTLDMVRKYVNYFSDEVADAHKKFSPIEKLF